MNLQLVLWLLGIAFALIAYLVKYESNINLSRPEIILDTIFNHALSIRNTGKNNAKNIKETTGYFRDVPKQLMNHNGTIDYIREKDFQIFRQIDFCDLNKIKPQTSVLVRFEYENSEGFRFYSNIKVRRNQAGSPPWFYQPEIIKTGRIWF